MALQQKLPPSDSGLRPTSSAEKRIVATVFRRHYDQLAGGVINPDRLTTLLYAKGLISTGTRDEVLTTQRGEIEPQALLVSCPDPTLPSTNDLVTSCLKGWGRPGHYTKRLADQMQTK